MNACARQGFSSSMGIQFYGSRSRDNLYRVSIYCVHYRRFNTIQYYTMCAQTNRMTVKKTKSSEQNKLICGVCGGALANMTLCATCVGDTDRKNQLNVVQRSVLEAWHRRPLTAEKPLPSANDRRQLQRDRMSGAAAGTSSSSMAGDSSVLSGSVSLSMSSATLNSSTFNSKYSSVISREIPPRIEASPEWIGALLMGWSEKKKSKRWNVGRPVPDAQFEDFINRGRVGWVVGSVSNPDSSENYIKNLSRRLLLPSYKDTQTLTNMCTKRVLVPISKKPASVSKSSSRHENSSRNMAPTTTRAGIDDHKFVSDGECANVIEGSVQQLGNRSSSVTTNGKRAAPFRF